MKMASKNKLQQLTAEETTDTTVAAGAISLHGDVLDTIFTHVPLIHLVPASLVSLAWHRSVSSSLSHLSPIKPWLLLHLQQRHSLSLTAVAYDPRSHVWIQIKPAKAPGLNSYSSPTAAPIRSSNCSLLYAISTSEFSFSLDPLHLTWQQASSPPKVWRADPVVARIGSNIIVAGGGYDFEDDPLAVEIYNLETQTWSSDCESMPSMLRFSSSASFLSVANDDRRMLVTEKSSGTTFSFNPVSNTWTGPFNLHPDNHVYFTTTGFCSSNRLISIGLVGNCRNVEGIRVWEFNVDTEELLSENRVLANVPKELVERLKGESLELHSISAVMGHELIYLMSGAQPGVVVVGEFGKNGGGVRWRCVENSELADDGDWIMSRVVRSCAMMTMSDLKEAVYCRTCKFIVK